MIKRRQILALIAGMTVSLTACGGASVPEIPESIKEAVTVDAAETSASKENMESSQEHTKAERSGDSTANFISWVNECMANK